MLYSKVSNAQLSQYPDTAIMEISNMLEKVFILTFLATSVDVATSEDDVHIRYFRWHAYICTTQKCKGISYKELKTRFPGRFMTKEDYGGIYNLSYIDDTNGQLDGDMCCETNRYFMKVPNTVLMDGRPCYVIHCVGIDEYQYVPSGSCSPRGSCNGQCLEEPAVHSLVCIQFAWPFINIKFRIAYMETTAYCSCKNIHD